MRTSPPLAITFDVGGTLIEPWPSVGAVYAAVAAKHGHAGLDPDELTRRFSAAWRARPSFDYSRAEWTAVVDATFDGLTRVPPSASIFPALYQRFEQADVWRIFDDVMPTLAALSRAGLRLGVISNWDERLRPLLGRLGLRDWFEVIAISSEVGCVKPGAAIYQAAAAGFGLSPARMLHVGDSLAADVEGARGAGFQALHLARGGQPAPGRLIGLEALPGLLA